LRLAVANRDMASFLHDYGHDPEAEPYFQKAVSLTDGLFDSFDALTPATQTELRRETGWLAVKVAEAQRDGGELQQADRSYRRAIELLAQVVQDPDTSYAYRLVLCEAHRGVGMIARERKPAEAGRELAEAETIARGVLKEAPELDPRAELARALVDRWGGLLPNADRSGSADTALDEAVALFDTITKQFPEITLYQRDRARALLVRGGRHAAAGRALGEDQDLTEALRVLTALMAHERTNGGENLNWSYPGQRGRVEVALARLRLRQGRADLARKLCEEGIGDLEIACQHRPRNVHDRQSLDEARQLEIDKARATRGGEANRP
jgi:tetratricopeptide (TPR) repeat protein